MSSNGSASFWGPGQSSPSRFSSLSDQLRHARKFVPYLVCAVGGAVSILIGNDFGHWRIVLLHETAVAGVLQITWLLPPVPLSVAGVAPATQAAIAFQSQQASVACSQMISTPSFWQWALEGLLAAVTVMVAFVALPLRSVNPSLRLGLALAAALAVVVPIHGLMGVLAQLTNSIPALALVGLVGVASFLAGRNWAITGSVFRFS